MPTTIATCEVYGTIFDVFGVPVEDAIVGCMSVYKNGALILAATKEVETDVDGYFTMDLPRDSVAVLYANTPGLNISCLGTPTAIPDADSAELAAIAGDFDLWNEVPVAIPIGAGVSSFNGRRGDVVLLSSDVTGALGYTPADAAALVNYVPLAGGTMSGFLTLSANPLSTFHAATKNYVDTKISDAIAAIPAGGVVSFNGRQGAVVPQGSDYAAFYAAISHTHTRAQITDLGIFSTSQPGLVPQPLAADAAKVLTGAGTWATVAAGVDTAANYDWTGSHTFAAVTRFNNIQSLTAGVVLEIANTNAAGMRLWAVSTSNALTLDSTLLDVRHTAGVAFRLIGAPTSGVMLRFNSSDASFNLRQRYTMFASGHHYFNAPGFPSPTDNSNATVSIWANDGLSTVFPYALQCNGAAVFTGAVTLPAAAPANPTDAASKSYVDAAVAAGGGGGVNLAANYPWTGSHSWALPVAVNGHLNMGPAADIWMSNGRGLNSYFANGQFVGLMQVWTNDVTYLGPYGSADGATNGATLFIRAGRGHAASYVQLDGASAACTFAYNTAFTGTVTVGSRLAINTPLQNDVRLTVASTGYPEFAMSFSNAVDASANFQVSPVGQVNSGGRGRCYLTSFGDFYFCHYTGLTNPDYMIAMYGPGSAAGGRAVYVYGYPADANACFAVTLYPAGTHLFDVFVNGDVALAHDPVSALHAVTKQYCDQKLPSSGGVMTGSLIQMTPTTAALTIQFTEEVVTLSTAGPTTDTVGNLLPVNSIILAVTVRVQTAIATATAFSLGDATVADRFLATGTALSAGSTGVGLRHWAADRVAAGQGAQQVAGAKVRVTCTGTPTAGSVRITSRYMAVTAPTS